MIYNAIYQSVQTNLTMLYSAIQVCANQPYNALQCNTMYKSVQTNHTMLYSAIYQSVQADRQIASIEMIHWPTPAF